MNQKEHLGSSVVHDRRHKSSAHPQTLGESQLAHPPQPSRRKKQARRRLLSDRSEQEDLVDLVEARREISTALRLHRATMKLYSNNQPQPPCQTHSESSLQATPQPHKKLKSKSRRNSKIYESNTILDFSLGLDDLSYQSCPYQTPQTCYSLPICASTPPPIPENFNLLFPNQTLGLNLNLQDFDHLDATLFPNNYVPAQSYSFTSPSPSTSISPPLPVANEETPHVGLSQAPLVKDPDIKEDLGLHHAVDDEEMAEIRSVGKQHQIEWDDTVNMVKSAWWFNFLNAMENDTNRFGIEFPLWLNTNDNCFQQLDEHYSSDYSPTLPDGYWWY